LAPQKVQIFSWQLILGRLPIRSNLSRILPVGVTSNLVLCPSIQKVEEHLFCRCRFIGRIWYAIFKWIGTGMILLGNIVSLLEYFSLSSLGKKNTEKCLLSFGMQQFGKFGKFGMGLFFLLKLGSQRRL